MKARSRTIDRPVPEAASRDPRSGGEGLKRVISFWDALALVVGLIIGSGIFRAPASVAQHLPSAALMMTAWTLGGLLSLAGGMTAAELGVRFPRSGGQYVFLREAFGPGVAFAFGWTTILISKPSVLAGIATVFAIYFSGLAGLPPGALKLLAAGAIALLTFVNCLGVKSGTRTQNLLTAVKAGGVALLGLAAFVSGRGAWGHFSAGAGASGLAPGDGSPHALPIAMALGLVTILYTYDGWIDVTYTGGEVIRPERVLPRAILFGTLVCTCLYLAANAAYIYLLDPAEMPRLQNVASVAFERAFGPAGGTILALLVVTSTLGILNGSILTGVRVPFAMGRDGMLFRLLGRVHPRTLSPVNALVAQGIFACLVVLFASGFDEIASLFVSTTWFFYAVSFAGLLVIQWRERREGSPQGKRIRGDQTPGMLAPGGGAKAEGSRYRMPLSPLPAVLFIVVTVFIIGSDLTFSGRRVLVGMGVVLAGVPIYWIWQALARPRGG